MLLASAGAASRVVYCSHTSGEVFGYSCREMRELELAQLLPPYFRARHAELVGGFLELQAQLKNDRRVFGVGSSGQLVELEVAV